MKPNHKSDPIAALQTLAATEAGRRAEARASNRASFPVIASICDEVRAVFPNAQFIHGEEDGREIGKRPADPPNVCTQDWTHAPSLYEVAASAWKGRR